MKAGLSCKTRRGNDFYKNLKTMYVYVVSYSYALNDSDVTKKKLFWF
jgi:hypothetical protein